MPVSTKAMPRCATFSLLLFTLLLAGCGDGRPALVTVSGQVLIDGEPLKYGFVKVAPANMRAAMGKLDEQGRFTLTTYEPNDGVFPGKHPVSISAGEGLNETDMRWHAPQKYSNPTTSELVIEVSDSEEPLAINLTWDGDKPYRTRNGKRLP